MLVNLQSLYVDVGHEIGKRGRDHQHTSIHPGSHVASKGVLCNDDGPSTSDERQENNEVTVNAMKQDQFVSDDRHELEADQKCGR